MTLEQLKSAMDQAIEVYRKTGDMTEIANVHTEMTKAKAVIAKAEAEKLLKESEALAGAREKLALKLFSLRTPDLVKELQAVKATGVTIHLDETKLDDNGVDVGVKHKTAQLLVATLKTCKAGGTGGGQGKSKDEFGMSLQDIVSKFATPEELAAIVSAPTNSKSWQLKVAVKKAAIAAGKLAPVK